MPIPAQEIRRRALSGSLGTVDPDLIQPASVDLCLGGDFLRYPRSPMDPVILGQRPAAMIPVPLRKINHQGEVLTGVMIGPGEFMLASTRERVCIPLDLAGQISGRSSIGRMGLIVHVTAGWIDPGFDGTITLELVNLSGHSIFLVVGTQICTLILLQLTEATELPYDGRYQYQSYTTPSRLYEGAVHGRKNAYPVDRYVPLAGFAGRQPFLGPSDLFDDPGASGDDRPLD